MTNTIIILISLAILLSFVVEIFSAKLKIPSVLLLLVIGVIARTATRGEGITEDLTLKVIPVLGTIGLVLIVFEGGLELDFNPSKKKVILKSLFVASANFLMVTLLLGFGIKYLCKTDFRESWANAIPLGVVSSAIAIPVAKFLNKKAKEFITYESVFSDIIGVLVLGYVMEHDHFSWTLVIKILIEMALIILICIVFCGGMLFLIKKSKSEMKYILILNNLLMVYMIGKLFHLPVLIVALIFGVVLKNFPRIELGKWNKYFNYADFNTDIHKLEDITKEGVFMVKTFFFLLLGYMINLEKLVSSINLAIVCLILTIIFLIRWVVLRVVMEKKDLGSLLFVSPRGLISVLLFIGIPSSMLVPMMNLEVLLLLILLNTMIIPVVLTINPHVLEQ